MAILKVDSVFWEDGRDRGTSMWNLKENILKKSLMPMFFKNIKWLYAFWSRPRIITKSINQLKHLLGEESGYMKELKQKAASMIKSTKKKKMIWTEQTFYLNKQPQSILTHKSCMF